MITFLFFLTIYAIVGLLYGVRVYRREFAGLQQINPGSLERIRETAASAAIWWIFFLAVAVWIGFGNLIERIAKPSVLPTTFEEKPPLPTPPPARRTKRRSNWEVRQ